MEFIVTTVVGTVPGVGRPRFIPSPAGARERMTVGDTRRTSTPTRAIPARAAESPLL